MYEQTLINYIGGEYEAVLAGLVGKGYMKQMETKVGSKIYTICGLG